MSLEKRCRREVRGTRRCLRWEFLDGSELLDFLSVSRCSASGNDGCEEVRRRGNCGIRGRELPFFPVWQRSDRRYDGLTATIPMDVEEAIRDVAREGCVGDEIST